MAERKPNFLIVGAPKCGTTALFDTLRLHPRIFLPASKEPNYFLEDPTPERRARYLALFDEAGDRPLVGEASVGYLACAEAPRRILAELGPIRVLASLRDPVDAIYSAYQHAVRVGAENLPLPEALEAERRRLGEPGSHPLQAYTTRARYLEGIRSYVSAFGQDRVLVLLQEEMTADPTGCLHSVLEFLGVEPVEGLSLARTNVGGNPRFPLLHRLVMRPPEWLRAWARRLPVALRMGIYRARFAFRDWNVAPTGYLPLDPDTRRTIADPLRGEVEELSRLLGRDLARWWPSFRTGASVQ